MPFGRATPGTKIIRYENNADFPFNPADWELGPGSKVMGISNMNNGLSVDGTISTSAEGFVARKNSVGSDRFIQAVIEPRSTEMFLTLSPKLLDAATTSLILNDFVGIRASFARGAGEQNSLREVSNGAVVVSDAIPAPLTAKPTAAQYRFSVVTAGDQARAYDFFEQDAVQEITMQQWDDDVGVAGFGTAFRVFWVHAYYECPSAFVTVGSVPAGGSAEVLDGSDNVLASGAESGGTVLIDMIQVVLPNAKKVVVKDFSGNVIHSYIATGTEIIEPGETYLFVAPDEFVAPVLGEVIGGVYDVKFTAVAGATQHDLEYSLNGGADWTVIEHGIMTAPDGDGLIVYPWDTTGIQSAEDVILRARGVAI